ncbi:MAG: amidase [Deltaproteobacteria bacterium]|nr:amidase [Deltaproteobacteria bacterium]
MSAPPNEHSAWLIRSASEMARALRAGEVSSLELVELHIARIKAVNPVLNAVVAERYELARQEARAADEALAAAGDEEALSPLLGVPCSIKECFALEGMPQASGLVKRKDIRATSDATTVARLRQAGAIPVGVTNTSELCMWMESANRLYGRTSNPYDPTRIVGGSSGGEGAIVGAGGTPFGLGSDIGGSIRMPAFFNGVFGHKPSGGLVPGTGQYPMAENEARRFLSTGPIARRAEDLMPIVRLLAGPDGIDTGAEEMELGDPATVSLDGMQVLSIDGNGLRNVSADLLDAQSRAASALAARGAVVTHDRIPAFKRSLDLWSKLMSAAEETPFASLLGQGDPIPILWEHLKWFVGRSAHTLPAIGLANIERLPLVQDKNPGRLFDEVRALREEIAERIGPDGVLLYPSYTRTAPRHGRPLLTPIDWVYTAIFNVLELPVTQVPLGLDAAGLPLGVQVAGCHGRDHVTIAAALALEEALGGWVPPWTVGCP